MHKSQFCGFVTEHGLNGEGPFQNPTGDIPVLANIINQMHITHPNLLISLTPQTANIGAVYFKNKH